MQNPENIFLNEYENKINHLFLKNPSGSELNKNSEKNNNIGKSQDFQNNLKQRKIIFKVDKENKPTKNKEKQNIIKTENNANYIDNNSNEDLSLGLFQQYDNDLFQNNENQLNKDLEVLDNEDIISNVESNNTSNNPYIIHNNKSYKTKKNVINDSNSQRIDVSRAYNTETIFIGKANDLK